LKIGVRVYDFGWEENQNKNWVAIDSIDDGVFISYMHY
jgi:hypothetical protein